MSYDPVVTIWEVVGELQYHNLDPHLGSKLQSTSGSNLLNTVSTIFIMSNYHCKYCNTWFTSQRALTVHEKKASSCIDARRKELGLDNPSRASRSKSRVASQQEQTARAQHSPFKSQEDEGSEAMEEDQAAWDGLGGGVESEGEEDDRKPAAKASIGDAGETNEEGKQNVDEDAKEESDSDATEEDPEDQDSDSESSSAASEAEPLPKPKQGNQNRTRYEPIDLDIKEFREYCARASEDFIRLNE